ncbi:MAG: ribosome biogenesis GTPase Der [Balneolaceae bacterium]
MNPVVSIVGRPNVGKSTFFNRLIGQRDAIVHDETGVTRDRHYGETVWNGRVFTVIDTGGYLPEDVDVIVKGVREQVFIAIEESDLILFVVDGKTGIHPLDEAVADVLRKSEKPVIVVANKADNERRVQDASEFYALGLEDLFPVSSISGAGTGDLLDRVVERLPDPPHEQQHSDIPKLAFVGRPNVGKSSMVNALLKSDRCIVTDVPGTTRDSINSFLEYKGKTYILVDTAGLRKQAKVKENIEFYSTVRTDRALRACDVAILLIDAMQGFDQQDKRILREAARFNKGIVLVLNKWDLVPDKETNLLKEFEEYIYTEVPTLRYIPIVSSSALTRQRVEKILDVSDIVLEERKKKIPTPVFNNELERILKERPLPVKRGRQLRIQYGLQVKSNPPVFKFFMNNPEDLPANYRRFLENRIRETYGFRGVPITMVFRQK